MAGRRLPGEAGQGSHTWRRGPRTVPRLGQPLSGDWAFVPRSRLVIWGWSSLPAAFPDGQWAPSGPGAHSVTFVLRPSKVGFLKSCDNA